MFDLGKKGRDLTSGWCVLRERGMSHLTHFWALSCLQALVDLQLHTGVQVRILESWKELGDFASMFTKAVAEAPFK